MAFDQLERGFLLLLWNWINFYRIFNYGVIVWNINAQTHFSSEEECLYKSWPIRGCYLEIIVSNFFGNCINTYNIQKCSWLVTTGTDIISITAKMPRSQRIQPIKNPAIWYSLWHTPGNSVLWLTKQFEFKQSKYRAVSASREETKRTLSFFFKIFALDYWEALNFFDLSILH